MTIKLANDTLKKSIIESIVDGPGIRLSVFFQGCEHYCKNCHNPQTWDMNAGYEYNVKEVAEYIINRLKNNKYYSGITITGGDPLYQETGLCELLKLIKNELPDTNIWCYTGFIYENIKEMESLKYINTIVDGPYIEEERDISLKFRGSKNQRIINLNI